MELEKATGGRRTAGSPWDRPSRFGGAVWDVGRLAGGASDSGDSRREPCPRLNSQVSILRAACVLPAYVSLEKLLGRVGAGR